MLHASKWTLRHLQTWIFRNYNQPPIFIVSIADTLSLSFCVLFIKEASINLRMPQSTFLRR